MAALTRRGLLAGLGAGALALPLAACSGGAVESLPEQGALVSVDGLTHLLDLDQAANAAIIVGEAIRRGLRARAATIALATALQESKLYNIEYGDRDSLGLFQQRTSQGWGTEEQIMDPWYSSGAFYDALVKIDGWDTGSINDVAQAVQRSGVPDGYAEHEDVSRTWASALYGYDPAAVTLVDRAEAAADAEALTGFVGTVWGEAVGSVIDGTTITFTVPDSPPLTILTGLDLDVHPGCSCAAARPPASRDCRPGRRAGRPAAPCGPTGPAGRTRTPASSPPPCTPELG